MQGIKKVFFLYAITLLIYEPGVAFTADNIVLPDPKIFQMDIFDCLPFLQENSRNKDYVCPKQITYDIIKRKITGIIAIYDELVKFDDVENAINKDYEKWRVKSLDNKQVNVRVWRVESLRFVIQLSRDDDGDIQVIFMKFYDRS